MSELDKEVRFLKGVGEKRAKILSRLDIKTVRDLLCCFPRKYEDRTTRLNIAEAPIGSSVCIRALVASEPTIARVKGGMELVKLRAVDKTGSIDIIFFNQTYVKDQLQAGRTYVFFGKIGGVLTRKSMINPDFESASSAGVKTCCIMPRYRLSAGISNKNMMSIMRSALAAAGNELPDYLPPEITSEYKLAQVVFSYKNIHFPSDRFSLETAKRRLIFEELFVLSCALGRMGRRAKHAAGTKLSLPEIDEFYRVLPFSPTGAQIRAVKSCLDDISSGIAMNRLLQGDVGSGKTLVAAACIWAVCKAGGQAAFMAPTEILAEQHLETVNSLLEPLGVKCDILTGSMGAKAKREAKERLANGETDLIIGTHALLSQDVMFDRLALVITDEQHRFGVSQRSALNSKAERPHTLVMSATPIPRTLALMIYGDLDVSILDELPPGRQKVDTFCVDSTYHDRLNSFIKKQVDEGHQVFVVCPMVDENDDMLVPLKSAVEHARKLSEELPDLRIECVHGKMKPKEKDAAMRNFVSGNTDVLVSTTVIEVGVDVPNATLMVVENAERFGLSQLHQLRGRVGRGAAKSYCVLVTNNRSDDTRARMKAMCSTNDGFKISRQDLKLRGPGDFFGSRQHGLPEMHIADMCSDLQLMQLAHEAAERVLAEDPELALPDHSALAERIDSLFERGGGVLS